MSQEITGLNLMVKNKLLLLLFFCIISSQLGCSSRILLSTKSCKSSGKFHAVEREFVSSLGDKFAIDIEYQKKFFDHVFVERVWTPLGQLSREKLDLQEVLRINGLRCSKVKSIEVTYYNDYVDIISSIIPFLSSRSILVKVITL